VGADQGRAFAVGLSAGAAVEPMACTFGRATMSAILSATGGNAAFTAAGRGAMSARAELPSSLLLSSAAPSRRLGIKLRKRGRDKQLKHDCSLTCILSPINN
jgi:hypothetical protein